MTGATAEAQIAQSVSEELRAEGFMVYRDPGPKPVPDECTGLGVDLAAFRSGTKLAVLIAARSSEKASAL